MNLPKPFLHSPLPIGTSFTYTAGWNYEAEEIAIHGVVNHKAIDFAAPKGTPILAAASGWAIATFGEYLLREPSGEPRLLHEKAVYFGSGLMVQIWHKHGRYTQYLHLDSINQAIPYYPPSLDDDGDYLNAPELKANVDTYGKTVAAHWMEAGEQIGTMGSTGLGLGAPTYPQWTTGDLEYVSWDVPHLHFVPYAQRAPRTRVTRTRWDPFGIYGQAAEYPLDVTLWHTLPDSLWLPSNMAN